MVMLKPGGSSIQKLWPLPPVVYAVALHTWVSSLLPEVDPVYGLEMLLRLMIPGPSVGDSVGVDVGDAIATVLLFSSVHAMVKSAFSPLL